MPSFANSSGSALAQKPLWDTRSGQAYLGRESGWMREGSLLVKPRRRAPLQQHCFLVIWAVGGRPQTAASPARPLPHLSKPQGKGARPSPQTTPRWGITLPSSSTIWAPFPPPGSFPTGLARGLSPWPLPSPLVTQGRLRKKEEKDEEEQKWRQRRRGRGRVSSWL